MGVKKFFQLCLVLGIWAGLSACAATTGADATAAHAVVAELPAWQSPRLLEHANTGRIVEAKSGRQLTAGELVVELAQQPLVLVGEKHDNPDHHALQLWLLQALAEQRKQGSLVLEMLTSAQQPLVDQVQSAIAAGEAPAGLEQALDWNRGWDWSQYGPIVEYAVAQPWSLRAGNLDRDELMSIFRNPPPAMTGLAGQAAVQETLAETIRESHCGKLQESRVPAMLAVQQQRDLAMAQVLLDAERPGMLIAGSYHVRKELGVPLHLQDLGVEDTYRVLVFLEADQDLAAETADYFWYTPATEEKDYCADW